MSQYGMCMTGTHPLICTNLSYYVISTLTLIVILAFDLLDKKGNNLFGTAYNSLQLIPNKSDEYVVHLFSFSSSFIVTLTFDLFTP